MITPRTVGPMSSLLANTTATRDPTESLLISVVFVAAGLVLSFKSIARAFSGFIQARSRTSVDVERRAVIFQWIGRLCFVLGVLSLVVG